MFVCPKCGAELDHLIRVTYREHRRKDDPRILSKGKYFKKQDFCCPKCGAVLARSYKKARDLLTKKEGEK